MGRCGGGEYFFSLIDSALQSLDGGAPRFTESISSRGFVGDSKIEKITRLPCIFWHKSGNAPETSSNRLSRPGEIRKSEI